MLKHIVMWKLKTKADAEQVKRILEALNGKIPTLKYLEVGINLTHSDASADVVLYSEFDDKAGLQAYQEHPEHQAVLPFMKSVVNERIVVDYKK